MPPFALFLSVVFCCSILSAADQGLSPLTIKQAQKLTQQGLKDQLGYQLVESLTTEVGPRLGGSEAEKRARVWAEKKFKKLGFKNVRIETFPLDLWERVTETAQVLPPYSQSLRITALGKSPSTPKGGVEGFVVRFASFKAVTLDFNLKHFSEILEKEYETRRSLAQTKSNFMC